MQEIRLETSDGCYVVTGLIPSFQTWPAVVIWGERVFRLHLPEAEVDHTGAVRVTPLKEGEVLIYREVFFVAVVETKQEP